MNEENIRRFIDEWNEKGCCIRQISCEGLTELLNCFKEQRKKDLSSGNYIDFFESGLMGGRENRFSSVLAWLLRKDGDHGQGAIFFNAFLDVLHLETDFRDSLIDYTVTTEKVVNDASRLDILIEAPKCYIAIEVKVYAPESGDQLGNYYEWLRNSSKEYYSLVYLTKDGRTKEGVPLTPVTWHELSNRFMNVLFLLEREQANFRETVAAMVIRQFCYQSYKF